MVFLDAIKVVVILAKVSFLDVGVFATDCRFPLAPMVRMERKCYWKTNGGNFSSAEDYCELGAGTLFSFDSLKEGQAVLELFNASQSDVFIGAIRLDVNGSSYYDWLATPDRFLELLNRDLDIKRGEDPGRPCVKFQHGQLVAESCHSEISMSICQREVRDNCSCSPCTNPDGDLALDGDLGLDFLRIPGPNGTTVNMSFGSVLDRVLDHSNYTESQMCVSKDTTTIAGQIGTNITDRPLTNITVTSPVHERENTTGGNTIKTMDGSGTEVPTYVTTAAPNEPAPPTHRFLIPMRTGITLAANSTKPTHPDLHHIGGVPVIDGRFQISGLHLGHPPAPSVPRSRPLLTEANIADHDVADVLRNTTDVLQSLRQEEDVDNSTLQIFAHTVNSVADNEHIQSAPDVVKEDLMIDIMRVAEELMSSILTVDETIIITTDALDIVSELVDGNTIGDDRVKIKSPTKVPMDEITLSPKLFRKRKDVRVSMVTYKKMVSFHNSYNSHVGSKVTSVTIHFMGMSGPQLTAGGQLPTTGAKDAIILVLETTIEKDRVKHSRTCNHWDFNNREWSTGGCRLVSQAASHTTCSCNHLTNFAVLVMYLDTEQVPIGSQQALYALTTVGCSVSIACLAMTLIAFVYLRMLSNEKIVIHANLSMSLMLAQIVFVSSNDAYRHKIACKVVAMLLHFLFLASFAWMLVEGINLYLCCTKGLFNQKDHRLKYFILGWGLPALIVIVSFAARFPDYGEGPQFSCWLSLHNGLIWAFVAPMLGIVLLNVLVMVFVVRAFLTLKTNSQKTDVARLRGSVRAMFTLLPLLGSGWILSLLVPLGLVFHYLFVVVNTVQGMCIFFLHCVCNEEMRKKFRARRRRWSTTRTGSDGDTNQLARRKTGSFEAIQVVATPMSASAERRSAWS